MSSRARRRRGWWRSPSRTACRPSASSCRERTRLFFAGARTLREALPDYAVALAQVGGRLYLSGVSAGLAAQLRRAGKLDLGDTVQVVPAQEVLGESAREAIEAAGRWVGRR